MFQHSINAASFISVLIAALIFSFSLVGVAPAQNRNTSLGTVAFGHDRIGQIGSETTINSGDMAGILMIAVQALEQRTRELKRKETRIAVLESRLEALELR